jgi:DNA-binding LytR/AlgR family response regulator
MRLRLPEGTGLQGRLPESFPVPFQVYRITHLKITKVQHFVFIRVEGKYLKVNFGDIMFIEGCKNYIKVVTTKRTFVALITMRQMEKALPRAQFCRIHRSYIVSINHIEAFDNESVYLSNSHLPMSNQYREIFLQRVPTLINEVRSKGALSKINFACLLN